MTEKQGAAEWLRGIIEEYEVNGDMGGCSAMAKMLGVYCEDVKTCRDCMSKVMEVIADRIDADRIDAERALPDGIEWPRFEDGEFVKVGDEVEYKGETMRVYLATIDADGWALWCSREGIDGRLSGSYGERVKRPAPKVLDADGVPIEVGDVVYFVEGSGVRYAVKDIGFEPDGAFVDIIDEEGQYSTMVNLEKLTHEPPDSWEQLSNDTKMGAVTYADRILGVDIRETTTVEDYEAFARDIVRRAKALVKAGEGL